MAEYLLDNFGFALDLTYIHSFYCSFCFLDTIVLKFRETEQWESEVLLKAFVSRSVKVAVLCVRLWPASLYIQLTLVMLCDY